MRNNVFFEQFAIYFKNVRIHTMGKKELDRGTKIVIGGIANKVEIEEFYKDLETREKKFDDYIIAYIDFLGIKEKMKKDSSFESLQILKFLLSGTKKTAGYISDINTINNFEIKIFSDNIVIAQKVNEEKLSEQIISIVNLIGAIQFHSLMQFDFWLRGGITIGELFIDNSVVWGTGLIEAYNIENNLANYPRVILADKILRKFEDCEKKALNLYALIKKDFDGLWFVDFILAAPNLKMIPTISEFLGEKVIRYSDESNRVKQKINWMITYFNSYCCKFKDRGNYEKYTLPYI